jgi:hypothetical protein
MFVPTSAEGVPRAGVTSVGLVANTLAPEPVSSVKAVSNCNDVNEPSEVALPTEVTAPVKLAFVVTLPAVKPEAVPVMFVPTKAVGVPSAGVTKVGLVFRTTEPVPVEVVTPVPPLTTAKTPVKLADSIVKKSVPLLNTNIPLAPAPPEFAVLIEIDPLVFAVPSPLHIVTDCYGRFALRLRLRFGFDGSRRFGLDAGHLRVGLIRIRHTYAARLSAGAAGCSFS